MENDTFLQDKENQFGNELAEVMYYLSFLIKGDKELEAEDRTRYETGAYVMENLANMARAFEQAICSAHNAEYRLKELEVTK